MPTILVVEDEEDILDLVAFNLQKEEYEVLRASNGNDGLALALEHMPDLVGLDLMLPGRDGFEVLKGLRDDSRTRNTPVLMLTAKAEVANRITGLKLGADDYVTKPFSPRELVLRVKALLRRATKAVPGTKIKFGPFYLDKSAFKSYLNDDEMDLTTTEFKLLSTLLEAQGQAVERATLLRDVWGYTDMVHTRTLDTHVKRLREKLGGDAHWIQTVRGIGYTLAVDPSMAQ
ncbi:MAG: response regulator [Verrucomicrobiaceae bacterium]|nr:response regulator [Verrucomicrobiaceae bacterium]